MTTQVTSDDIRRMIHASASRVIEAQKLLSDLDSIAGDGDHGAAMLRVMHCLEEAFAIGPATDLKQYFSHAGWGILGTDGGASSSLLGVFFLGVSDGLPEACTSLDCVALAEAFHTGLATLQNQTKACPGDKTMMDALVPAITALREAAQSGADIESGLEKAASAAQAGAAATSKMTARYGRARLLGEKTLGHPDAGATSIALIFEGFSQGYSYREGK